MRQKNESDLIKLADQVVKQMTPDQLKKFARDTWVKRYKADPKIMQAHKLFYGEL